MLNPMYQKTIHVPQGMERIATEAAVLKTFVGSDFVIAASQENGCCCGGLASFTMPQATGETAVDEVAVPGRVDKFLQGVRSSCAGNVVATIAGGANVLGMFPARTWGPWALAMAETITELVRRAGMTVTQTEVGGIAPRQVTLDLTNGVVQIEASRQPPRASEDVPARCASFAPGAGNDWPVDIGEARVHRCPDRLVAVLGSCVGIALFDPSTRIGGLAHVVMPKSPHNGSQPLRYVDTAVPLLLAQLEREGAHLPRLQAKLAGGASGLVGNPPCFQTGTDNIFAARECLARAGIPILAEHVGGRTGRKIIMDLRSFRVSVQWLEGAR
jgi:chemotaxis protein CheD